MNTTTSSAQYLLLFRGNGWDHSLSPGELQHAMEGFLDWFGRLNATGILKAAQPLMDEGRTVSGKHGRIVADGPFAESKEAVGGYFLITAASLDEAVAIAQQCPLLELGSAVEVRPVAVDCPTLQRARRVIAEAVAPVQA
jgi:hypothetical protein